MSPELYFGWPQLVWLATTFAGLGLHLARHGRPRTETDNIFLSLAITTAFVVVFYYGGFFTVTRP
jgi:hypothetical protein